jgi:hypothetical protein
VQIWDFDLSTVKPVATHKAGVKLTCLLFSPNSPIVVCGAADGRVSLFRCVACCGCEGSSVGCAMRDQD